VHPEDLPKIYEATAALANGDYYTAEYRVLNRDNKYVYILDQGLVVARDENGFPLRVVGSTTDITERIQAQEALRESETILNAFLSSSPIGLALFDRDLRDIYANQALATINGQPLSIYSGATLAEVMPQMATELAPLLHQIRETREAVLNLEFNGEISPGVYRHCLVNHFPVCLPNGEVLGVGVTVMDVSEMKRIEAALRESEAIATARAQELETLMEITPVALWIAHDPQCHQMTANRTAYELMRLPPGSITTSTPADGGYPFQFKQRRNGVEISPDDLPIQKAARTGEEVLDELEFVFEDGTVLYIYGRAIPLRNESGEVRGVMGAFIDITERRRAEQEREELLAQERLAREEAEAANRIKDEFLAVLSHELRSPLNPILGWSKLLQTRKLDEKMTKQALETIERNARLQTQLIEDLLDVSRILQGKLILNRTPVPLAATIEAALETVKLAVEAKNIQIQKVFAPSIKQIIGDSARIQQVVWNLLSNAVKFTPSGGTVEIRLEQVNSSAQIQVRDTGIGISREFLPYVFDYFRQEDGKTTRKFGGLGLGLAIVRHLTELHGGTVKAESLGEGLGAIFTVKLPLMAVVNNIPESNQKSDDVADLTGLQVLAVDDEPDIRDLVAFILEQAGAEVRIAKSGIEALNLLSQSLPDLIICDVGMPDMDGYMLMRQIRMRPPEKGGKIPAIALTAYAGEIDQKQAIASGFQLHLAKPIDPADLIRAIANLVN